MEEQRQQRRSSSGSESLKKYLREISRLERISPQEERELGARIQDGDAAMVQGSLQERLYLSGVAGKAARDEGGVGRQCFQANVQGRQVVDACVFQLLTHVRCGAELALSEPVDAIVFHDVSHSQIPAEHMFKLAHAYTGGISIATHANR